jgi:hypothetical protein
VAKSQERDLADQVFSTRNFLRTLSYREFLTSLSFALLLLAFYSAVDYYSNEDWIKNNDTLIKWALFCLLLPTNHIFYKIEHKRQNNFIGRNLHDYIFILIFLALYKLQVFLNGATLSFNINGIGGAIVFMLIYIIMVILFELAVAIVKRVLKLLRWRVL